MNYSFDEALKVVGDFLEANEANYTVQRAWEAIKSAEGYSEDALDEAWNEGYDMGKREGYDNGYDDGYSAGVDDAKEKE